MRALLLAISFLTRYPIRIDWAGLHSRDFGKATGYFPLIGLLVGLDIFVARWVCLVLDPGGAYQAAWSFFLLLYWVWSMDSLHLDGLADTVDGLASGRKGAELLAIMRQPANGAFASQAVALTLIGKYVWLFSLPLKLWWALPLPFVFSRLLASLACQFRPYQGGEGTLSSLFVVNTLGQDQTRAVGWAFVSYLALAGPAVWLELVSPQRALAALLACLGAVALGRMFMQSPLRRLGGVSGDVIGYGLQLTELIAAFALLLFLV